MEKRKTLENVGNSLLRPTGALLGITLLAGTVAAAERGFPEEPQQVMVERSDDSPEFAGPEVIIPTIPNSVPYIEQEEAVATSIVTEPAPTTTLPLELPQNPTAPVAPPVVTTVPVTAPAPVPAALVLDQSTSDCPIGWSKASEDVCYTKQAGFHVVQVDASDQAVSICPAYTSEPGRLGRLDSAAQRLESAVAINSSFFYDNGRALGPLACAGQWLSQDTFPQIVFAYYNDGAVTLQPTEQALQADVTRVRFAVSGSHALVQGGQVQQDFGKDNQDGVLYKPHARTAIGMNESSQLYMAVTEAGNKVTMPEMAQFMGSLGVREALNLDGGGSSQMHVQNQNLVDRAENERAISTGLFVIPTR